MKCKLHILFCSVFFLWKLSAQNDKIIFTQLPPEAGLNNTGITAIAQDSRGQLWFGTWVGLYRYDGFNAKLYKSNIHKENTLTSNKITHILSTKKGELYIATLRGGVLKYRFEYDDFEPVLFKDNTLNSLKNNVWHLYEDKHENIWAATEKGLAILIKGKSTFENDDAFIKSNINTKRAQYITNASSDYIWVGTDDGVYVYFADKDGGIHEMSHYTFQFPNYTDEQSNYIYNIHEINNEKLFILCKSGIVLLDISRGFEKASYSLINSDGSDLEFPRTLIAENLLNASYLVGTHDGIRFIDKNNQLISAKFLEGKVVRSSFKDSFGSLWLGTENGLFKLSIDSPLVKKYSFEGNKALKFSTLENITYGTNKENIWMAWQHGMISNIKLPSLENKEVLANHFQIQKPNGKILKDRISQLACDGNNSIWIGTQGSGIIRINEYGANDVSVIKATEVIDHSTGLYDNYIMSLAYNQSRLWFGSWNSGLYNYDIKTKKVSNAIIDQSINQHLKSVAIIKILFIDANTMLVATRGNGVYIFTIKGDQSLVLKNQFNKESNKKLTNDFITDVRVFKNQLWILSEGGIDLYDLHKNEFIPCNINELIPKSIIQSISVLNDSSIWISTYNDGVVELYKKGNNYGLRSYVKSSLTNYASNSTLSIDENRCLFGGAGGFSLIDRRNKNTSHLPPIPFINGIRIENHNVTYNEEINGSIKCDKVVSELPKIKLNYKDNSISIHLSAFHSTEHQELMFAYILEGFHEDWIYTGEKENVIHFTNLNPKNYTFKFKAANSDGIWSAIKELKIKVTPPWWLSPIAYFFYCLLLIGLVYSLIQLFLAKARYEHDINLEKMERAKVEELNQMKMKFYTTISHELRTPLTMIISPLEQLMQQKDKVDIEKSHHFILRNAKKLHGMINQLLDFRKHESNSVDLQLKKMDFIEFSKEVLLSFQSLAQRKNINVSLESSFEKLYMPFDAEQLEKMYNNLISNSLKYTQNKGYIKVFILQADMDKVKVVVEDNGLGINAKDIDHIFDRFYQGRDHVHSGYGLGLSIVKSIVELHQGSIKVESEKGIGTKFIIHLPTDLAIKEETEDNGIFIKDQSDIFVDEDEIENLSEIETQVDLRKKMLIVEDNDEIKEYLKENFASDYEISLASDGDIGLNIAFAEVPDIIISDIAMERMDGLTLCKKLKGNIATSHIPIILLTARTAVDYKMEGYDLGANAYVTKPFNMELLKKQVINLLGYRDVLKTKYLSVTTTIDNSEKRFEPSMPPEEALDQKFMAEFVRIVENNLHDSELTIDDIAKEMYMSRIQVYRKVKALSGQTPNVFIRVFRLKRAAQYLSLGELSISEITYKVGFNDLKYFREKFKEEFGVNPSEYKNSLKQV